MSFQDEKQGKMLLHTEHSLLSLLSGMEGVVQKHDFFTEMCLMEESNPGNGSKSIYNGRKLRRICLVLDCLTPNDFTNRTQNLVNLQVVICQNDSFNHQLFKPKHYHTEYSLDLPKLFCGLGFKSIFVT